MTQTETTTCITQVGTVIVPVSDQDRALDFFLCKLGFEHRMDASYGGARWVEVAPPGAATTIALVAPREGDPTGFEVSFNTQDAEADHADLRHGESTSTPRSSAWEISCRRCSRSATRTATGTGWSNEADSPAAPAIGATPRLTG